MHLNIDGQEYHINLHKVTDDIRLIYENHVIKGIPFPNGYKITFEKKSIPVLALKQVLTMMVIPMLVDLYKLKGYEIERKKKHEDALDYFIRNALTFIGLIEHEHRYLVTTIESDVP